MTRGIARQARPCWRNRYSPSVPPSMIPQSGSVPFQELLPTFPAGVNYLLVPDRAGDGWKRKPYAFPTFAAQLAHIHRARAGRPIELRDASMRFRATGWEAETLPGVSIWAQDAATGDRADFLGWAYAMGASRVTLEAALADDQPPAMEA